MLVIYDLFCNNTDVANSQVGSLSHFAQPNLDWRKMKYKQYNDFLKVLDCSGRVREVIKQYRSAQQRKIQATKKVGDLWQHNPKLLEIVSDSSGTENCM